METETVSADVVAFIYRIRDDDRVNEHGHASVHRIPAAQAHRDAHTIRVELRAVEFQ